jgi:transcriptional regulatory protein LevR
MHNHLSVVSEQTKQRITRNQETSDTIILVDYGYDDTELLQVNTNVFHIVSKMSRGRCPCRKV